MEQSGYHIKILFLVLVLNNGTSLGDVVGSNDWTLNNITSVDHLNIVVT
jgi:hypothetical protein